MWSENYVRRGVFLFWTCCINQRYPQSPRCEVPGVQTLTLQFNIDGIPLFKSTRTALWPNLCRIKNVSSMAFTVAVFAGDAKPTLKPYLADFLVELKEIMREGHTFQQHVFKVELNFFVTLQHVHFSSQWKAIHDTMDVKAAIKNAAAACYCTVPSVHRSSLSLCWEW